MSSMPRAALTPRDCGARVEAIRASFRALDNALGALVLAWDAEILRKSPHLADCVRRVPPAASEAELVVAQDAWTKALAELADEVAKPFCAVQIEGGAR